MAGKILKSAGLTTTEKRLSRLCEGTFLKLWSYPNPFRERGKELCDLIAVFENHVYLFFDRENKTFFGDIDNFDLAWERWKKEAVTKQIKSAKKARAHVLNNRDEIYLDASCTAPLPVRLPDKGMIVHVVIVAHGASEACKNYSPDNISGSLGIIYSDDPDDGSSPMPFIVKLERSQPVHLLDSHTVEIMLRELDTFYDFTSYIAAKENAIASYGNISYAGEEDLLAHYYFRFDEKKKQHYIGVQEENIDFLMIGEGEWRDFIASGPYKRKKEADKDSYLWDELIQRTGQNALDGTLLGDGVFEPHNAIVEMAREPRFSRRELAKAMRSAIEKFPDSPGLITRNLSFMPSFYSQTGYVFLQVRYKGKDVSDEAYRSKRRTILEIACGVARNKFPRLRKIVGMAIDAPKFAEKTSEDFILMHCDEWPDDRRKFYEEQNKGFNFFETDNLKVQIKSVSNFPAPGNKTKRQKVGRNEPCPCGSGKKYKKCHGSSSDGR